ncbi:MAG: redoxin domain-containing protein [Halobacteriota archaeon]
MRSVGTTVPDVTAPAATPEAAATADRGSYTSEAISAVTLSELVTAGPVTLAFFPGVYSRTCTQELCQLRDWIDDLSDLGGPVYGVSVDTPWSQLAFVDEYDLSYPLLSTFNNSLAETFDVVVDSGLLRGITRRSVFVLDADLTVRYAWETEESLVFPDLDAIEATIEAATTDE